jgi:predicted TPR repeat methyltransferase
VSVERRLETVYHAASREELSKTYDKWAATYDADMQSIGYVHPAICVGLVARYVTRLNAKILDAGVGTGNIGQLLDILGYSNLNGIDMSDGMLARAAERKIYSDLRNQILGEPLSFASASVDCIVSTGTFTTGHAPASAFDELVRIVKPGGHLIFTVGTKVWSEAGFDVKLGSLPVTKVEVTKIYHPMPLSETESGFTTRAFVYRKL